MDARRLLGEVSRFITVGMAATLVAFVIFNYLLHGWGALDAPMADHAIGAYILANTIGMLVSYRGTRSWAFRHRPPVHADGGRSAYVLINVVTMAIPVVLLWLTRDGLGIENAVADNVSANVIGLGLGFAARFWLFRRYVFRSEPALVSAQQIEQ
ncbi:GtrA family protein [Nocardioides sp. InS609-2]|uniref:GtrA family protein n=1 Tax=Nocardioides sp. InS609-2 TaxID=2760705 RepID=UPI0020BE316E|nr:GtrA family protein [Nocardioides sp. InS609-2]